jgi:hypothetical protein
MALKQFKTLELKDRETIKLQENISEYLDRLPKNLLDGVMLTSISIGTSTTNIPHGLARSFLGFIITDLQGDARVWRDTDPSIDKTKYLPLKASSSVTANIWVF